MDFKNRVTLGHLYIQPFYLISQVLTKGKSHLYLKQGIEWSYFQSDSVMGSQTQCSEETKKLQKPRDEWSQEVTISQGLQGQKEEAAVGDGADGAEATKEIQTLIRGSGEMCSWQQLHFLFRCARLCTSLSFH